MTAKLPSINVLSPNNWTDYELLDSGEGAKLERFGKYTLVRPERSALWHRSLPKKRWEDVDAVFEQGEAGTGQWILKQSVPDRWLMRYRDIAFWARLTRFRHTGVFPEQASHWDWIDKQIRSASRPVSVLNLFGYTGIASLVALAAGASVTHVDASKPALGWAKENAEVAGLGNLPIRWILDDALKFIRREQRRGKYYDGIIMDPPVFGRGPKGEIWRFSHDFPTLLQACIDILAERALFVIVTAYEISESSLLLHNLLADGVGSRGGQISVGELVLQNKTGSRPLSTAMYARWSSKKEP